MIGTDRPERRESISTETAKSQLPPRALLDTVARWIDQQIGPLADEEIFLAEAAGRVLAQGAVATRDVPEFDRAAIDGLALRAEETAGASAYNPLRFRLVARGSNLPLAAAMALGVGDKLPAGADGIAPLELVEKDASGSCEVIETIAPGNGIERKASQAARGATLLETGRRLLAQDLVLLLEAGFSRVQVTRRPRIGCFRVERSAMAPGSGLGTAAADVNAPMLRALIARDGGIMAGLRALVRDPQAIGEALAQSSADLVLLVGGNDSAEAPASAALASRGELIARGVAISPGETACLGRSRSGKPVVILPVMPADCLWAYELLAGRAIRRLAGRSPRLPFRTRAMIVSRKLVSAIGVTEILPVRCLDPVHVEPVARFEEAGLAGAARADGFVLIPEGSEGVPAGTSVTVHFFEDTSADD